MPATAGILLFDYNLVLRRTTYACTSPLNSSLHLDQFTERAVDSPYATSTIYKLDGFQICSVEVTMQLYRVTITTLLVQFIYHHEVITGFTGLFANVPATLPWVQSFRSTTKGNYRRTASDISHNCLHFRDLDPSVIKFRKDCATFRIHPLFRRLSEIVRKDFRLALVLPGTNRIFHGASQGVHAKWQIACEFLYLLQLVFVWACHDSNITRLCLYVNVSVLLARPQDGECQ